MGSINPRESVTQNSNPLVANSGSQVNFQPIGEGFGIRDRLPQIGEVQQEEPDEMEEEDMYGQMLDQFETRLKQQFGEVS